MSGYEKSPDYGDGGGHVPPWAPWVALVVIAAAVVGCAWLGAQ